MGLGINDNKKQTIQMKIHGYLYKISENISDNAT